MATWKYYSAPASNHFSLYASVLACAPESLSRFGKQGTATLWAGIDRQMLEQYPKDVNA
jgi:hypothetical protein